METSSPVDRPPAHLDRLVIPTRVLDMTLTGLRLGADREMLCYWLGVALPVDATGRTRSIVVTVAFPRVHSDYASFRVAEGQMGLITSWCAERNLWLLAQVHTHPTDEPHSEADECWPASHRSGFFSVVVPFFAQLSTVAEPAWRVYECEGGGRWSQVDPRERLELLPSVWLPEG